MSWQNKILTIIFLIFGLLWVLKNLSLFRKKFLALNHKERATPTGKKMVKELQSTHIKRSVIGVIALVLICIVLGVLLS